MSGDLDDAISYDFDPMMPMALTPEQDMRAIALRLALGLKASGDELYDVADEFGRYIATGARPSETDGGA